MFELFISASNGEQGRNEEHCQGKKHKRDEGSCLLDICSARYKAFFRTWYNPQRNNCSWRSYVSCNSYLKEFSVYLVFSLGEIGKGFSARSLVTFHGCLDLLKVAGFIKRFVSPLFVYGENNGSINYANNS